MSTKVEETQFTLDWLKWLVVGVLVIGGAVANSYYSSDFALYLRVLALLAVGGLAAFLAVNTAKGSAFWDLLKAAQVEVRKVVWPSRQETTQTTLIVAAVVVVTAIVLWGLDTGLGYLASLIIG
ncbi:preprotein translocase subunit SecE [Alteromonadaceae bacterium 2753L.S.0a.02]|nr:preprotein translocase subunit SecE [Alteromonadaceae bacterium 2753L.S.0a.02]